MSTRLYLCPIDFNRAITLGRRGRWFDSIPIYNTVTSKVAGKRKYAAGSTLKYTLTLNAREREFRPFPSIDVLVFREHTDTPLTLPRLRTQVGRTTRVCVCVGGRERDIRETAVKFNQLLAFFFPFHLLPSLRSFSFSRHPQHRRRGQFWIPRQIPRAIPVRFLDRTRTASLINIRPLIDTRRHGQILFEGYCRLYR